MSFDLWSALGLSRGAALAAAAGAAALALLWALWTARREKADAGRFSLNDRD